MTRAYPPTGLKKVIEKLRPIYDKHKGNDVSLTEFMSVCGYSYPANGTAQALLSSCASFGLILTEGRWGSTQLSPLATEIFSEKELNFVKLQEIAQIPPLFKAIKEYFPDDKIPFVQEVQKFFKENCFLSDYNIKVATKSFYSTMEYVHFFQPYKTQRNKIFDAKTLTTIYFDPRYTLEDVRRFIPLMLDEYEEKRKQLNTSDKPPATPPTS